MTQPIGADLFRYLQSAGDPSMLPDGSRCAYVLSWIDAATSESRSRIYQIDTAAPGAAGVAKPQPFTRGDADTHPRYSPDGNTGIPAARL